MTMPGGGTLPLTLAKYILPVVNQQTIQMPQGTWPLSVQYVGTELTLWAEVHADQPMTDRQVWIIRTGFAIPVGVSGTVRYIGTVQPPTGAALHVYVGG